MRVVCIVQARLNSKRLPRKILLPLNGHTVLEEVLTRCGRIPGIAKVVCAVPTSDYAELQPIGEGAGAFVIHGSENDVLSRYRQAVLQTAPDAIMRITADCPLLCPELCGAVLTMFIREKADYASNIKPRTFPKGMDCEVFKREVLRQADKNSLPEEREHVTPWMQRAAGLKRVNVCSPWPIDGRLTLDTLDDYKTICAAFDGHH